MLAFLEGIRNQDLNQALYAFPWKHSDVGKRFREIILADSSYTPEKWPAFPGNKGLMNDLDTLQLFCQNADAVCLFLEAFTYPDIGTPQSGVMPASGLRRGPVRTQQDADALIASFDLTRLDALSGMNNIRILTPDEATDGAYSANRRLKDVLKTLRTRYDADEICERAAYFSAGGQEYVFAPVLARYKKAWYIVSLSGQLAGKLQISGSTGCIRLIGDAAESAPGEAAQTQEASLLLPWQETGGETPEAAVSLYLDGLRRGDLNAVMSAFGWDTVARHTDLSVYCLETAYYSGSNAWPVFPAGNSLLEQADSAMLVKLRLNRLVYSLADYYTDGAIFDSADWARQGGLPVRSKEDAKAVLGLFDEDRAKRLGALSDISFVSPQEFGQGYNSEALRQNTERYRAAYGADELTELIAVFDIGGEKYVIMPQLLRYGERWYIGNMSSIAAAVFELPLAKCALCRLAEVKR